MPGDRALRLSVLSVPAEVLQAVGGWLKPEEREQARLACRHFHNSFTSELLTLLVRPQSVADVSWHYVREFFKRFPHSTKAMLYLTGHWSEANYQVLAQHIPLIPNRVKKLTVLAGAGFQLADPNQLDSQLLRPLLTLKQLEELEVVSVQADTSFPKHLTRLTYLVLAPCTPAPDYFWVSLFVKSQVPQLFSPIPSSAQHWRCLSSLQQLSIELPTPAPPPGCASRLPSANDVITLLQPVSQLLQLQKFLLGLSSSVLLHTGIQASEPAKVVCWLLDVLPGLLYVKLRNVQYEQEKMHLEMQDPDQVQDVPALWGAISWQRQRLTSQPCSLDAPSPSSPHASFPSCNPCPSPPSPASPNPPPIPPSTTSPSTAHPSPTSPAPAPSPPLPSGPSVSPAPRPHSRSATNRRKPPKQKQPQQLQGEGALSQAATQSSQVEAVTTQEGGPSRGRGESSQGQGNSSYRVGGRFMGEGDQPLGDADGAQEEGELSHMGGETAEGEGKVLEPARTAAQQGALELSLWVPPCMSLSEAMASSLQNFHLDQVVKLELVHFKSRVTDLKTLTSLSRLTCLYLNGAYSTAGLVRQLSCLKSLQELQLDGYVDDCWRASHNITTTVSLRPQSAALLAQALPALKFLGCEGRISRGALHPLVDLSQLQGLSVMDLPTSPCCSMRRSTPTLHSLPTALTCIDLFDVQLVALSAEAAGAGGSGGPPAPGRPERARRRGAYRELAAAVPLPAAIAAPPAALPHLCMLKLTRCTVDSLDMLSTCSRLQCMLVADCRAAEGTADVSRLSTLWPFLRRLECVEDSQPHPHCSPCPPRFRFFDLWAQDSSLEALRAFKDLKHFAAIQVNGDIASRISDAGVASLASLTALRSLSLEVGDSATDDSISSLARMSWLRTLELRVPEHMEYQNALTKLRANLSQAEVAVSNHLFVSIC